jgi:ParB family chromosome partitioning protein
LIRVDTDAIALKVKQEFSAKEKARKAPQPTPKILSKAKKAA